MQKLIEKKRDMFNGLRKTSDMVAHVLKMAMDDEEVVETIKHAIDMEDKEAKISPYLRAQKRNAGNQEERPRSIESVQ
jgi:hypothetical protein